MSDLEEFPQTLNYTMDRIPMQSKNKSASDNRFVNRKQDWHRSYRKYELRFPVQDQDQLDTTETFWLAHNFSDDGEDAFLIEDPRDHTVSGTQFGTGDNDTKEFRLKIDYSYGNRNHTELARYIQSGTETIYKGGSGTNAYSINNDTGVVTFNSAPDSGTKLTADFDYFRKVVFLEDELQEAFVNDIHTDVEFTVEEVP